MAGCKAHCVTWLCFVCCWTLLTDRALGQEAATVSRVPAPGPKPSLAPITAPPWPQHALAPYIDATSWPLFDFVSAAKNQGVRNFRLGFVVASAPTQATPSWGGYYDVASGYRLQEINALRRLGGDVAVSFGGSNGTELAGAATSVKQLQAVYQSVIDAYGARVCDFDIEGVWIGDPASIARRSQAIAALQVAMAAKGRPLEVWYTIPAAPSGLTRDGIKVVQSAISYGVSLRGVNIMAMDYGDSVSPAPQGRMGTYAVDAANGLFRQLQSLYSRNGKPKLPNEIWRMIGVTPMIGVNDVPTEIFRQSDAQKLLAFAKKKKLGLLSFWSINRDRACEVNRSSVNPTCSGIPQTPHQFTQILRPFVRNGGVR